MASYIFENVSSLEERELKSSMVVVDEVPRFSILQYNILSDCALPPVELSGETECLCGSYSYCPAEHRYMNSRHVKIMSEVRCLNPEIICLQEVDHEHYYNKLKPDMARLGYDSVHHLRWFDYIGLAIFYKSDGFLMEKEYAFLIHSKVASIGLSSKLIPLVRDFMVGASTYPGKILPPGCLMVQLRHRQSGRSFCVATTHITWRQFKCPTLQVLQVCCVVNELADFAQDLPIVMAGDFNATPEMPVYSLITDGQLTDGAVKQLVSSDCILSNSLIKAVVDTTSCSNQDTEWLRSVKLKKTFLSSYASVMGYEPAVTNSDEGLGTVHSVCVDYIWITRGDLKAVTVLDVPSLETITKHTSLPSVVFPSDHILLFSILTLT